MHTTRSFFGIACRIAAFSFLIAGTASLMHAQQAPAESFAKAPLFLASSAQLDLSSSSSSSSSSSNAWAANEAAVDHFDLKAAGLDSSQPPPRRRYGRPNYSDSHSNPDGSNKYTFMVGAGFTLPTGGTHNYATPSWKFQVGGGRNFNKTVGVLLQFDWDHFGMQTSTLNKELALYNGLCGGSCGFSQLGGNIHDWSFTLDPIVNYYTSDTWGAYVTGGPGFYHKYTQFTTRTTGVCYDPYYGYYTCSGDQPIDWYTSNAFGVNGGLGFTYKFSRWANERFFVEARYVWTDNQPKPYDTSGKTAYFNAFPQASARTTYIPITFGLRF
ncbi:MAG TPA: hypothetical protein VF865_21600 [Acidobacteriaceae bacterium]